MVLVSMSLYAGSPTSVVLGRYEPGGKQPPGPQKTMEYVVAAAGSIAKPKSSVQEDFQKPASGWALSRRMVAATVWLLRSKPRRITEPAEIAPMPSSELATAATTTATRADTTQIFEPGYEPPLRQMPTD